MLPKGNRGRGMIRLPVARRSDGRARRGTLFARNHYCEAWSRLAAASQTRYHHHGGRDNVETDGAALSSVGSIGGYGAVSSGVAVGNTAVKSDAGATSAGELVVRVVNGGGAVVSSGGAAGTSPVGGALDLPVGAITN